ncbi:MAG: CapA family protein [Spirochaetales bacterium]|nr:CapA family protein [Spirochaetales bacterium]
MANIAKLVSETYALFHRNEFKYPIQGEENTRYMSLKETMWFAYKISGHPMEHGEKGKNIEEYFANQDLSFKMPEGFKEESKMVVTAGGDLLASRHINAKNAEHFWDDAEEFFFNSDVCCANLETPVVPSRPPAYVPKTLLKTFPLNNAEEMFDVFHRGGKGINLFTTANNHALDMGPEGVGLTLDFIDKSDCLHVGTSRSFEERDNFPVIEKDGLRTAFISFTYALNKSVLPEGEEYLANYQRLNLPGADLSLLKKQIKQARNEKNADVVVACLHFSTEFDSYPLQTTIDMAHRIMEMGVDVIIGNHAHTVQPIEKYRYTDPFSGKKKEGLIVYALGDIVTPVEWEGMINSRLNNLIRVEISKGNIDGETVSLVSGLQIRPMYVYAAVENDKCSDFRLLNLFKLMNDIEKSPVSLTEKDKREVKRLGTLASKLLSKEIASL